MSTSAVRAAPRQQCERQRKVRQRERQRKAARWTNWTSNQLVIVVVDPANGRYASDQTAASQPGAPSSFQFSGSTWGCCFCLINPVSPVLGIRAGPPLLPAGANAPRHPLSQHNPSAHVHTILRFRRSGPIQNQSLHLSISPAFIQPIHNASQESRRCRAKEGRRQPRSCFLPW